MQKIILVAAREASVRHEVSQVLRGKEYLVLAVPDESMALDAVQHSPIALLILDRLSFHQGGLELCRQVRASARTASLPILMLCNSGAEIAQLRENDHHIDDFLLKPVLPDELLARMRALLKSVRRQQRVLLVVEPDANLRSSIVTQLREEGFIVLAAADGTVLHDLTRDNLVSLVIIDRLSLPSDGLELCRQLRASSQTEHIPLLLLVASDIEVAQIVNAGPHVDDFLIKPFVQAELHACVHALLRLEKGNRRKKRATTSLRRRIDADGERQILVAEDIRVDVGLYRVTKGDQVIKLGNALLFDLLVYLLRHRGMVLSRDQLYQQVWGSESATETRTVDVHVHWLRQKLQDDPVNPQLIQTIPGVGYRFKDKADLCFDLL